MSVISTPAVCRACLSSNIYVCPATQEYIDQFVSLTKLTIQESDGKPLGLCHTCCYYIRKYHKFQERCLQADAILNQHNLLHAENYIGEDFNLMGLTPELRCTPVTIIDVTQEHSQLLTNLEVKQERGALTYDEVGVKFEASEDILSAGYVEPLAETVVMPVITNTFENVRELWKDPLSNDTLDSMHDGSKNVLQILDLVQQSDSLGELKNEPDHETRYQSEDIELIHESVSQNETQYSPQRLDFSPNKLKSEGVNSASQELLPKGSQKYNIGGNIFQCPVCERKFNSHSKLKQHLRKLTHNTHTGEKPFQCEVCDRRFKYKCNLKQHLITHTGERPYQCSVCEKSFYKKSKLNQHLITHTGVKPYQCSVCDKRFYVKSYLNQHLITHTEEKPYQCSMCQKTFYTKDKLNRHLVTHTGDRPYQCLVCEKRFKMKSHLKDHVRTHTGKKLYQCEVCDKRFNCKSYLKKHLVRHTGQRQFQCLVCEKRFNCKSDLKHHVMTHTGE